MNGQAVFWILSKYSHIQRFGSTEEEADIYEFKKSQALKNNILPPYSRSFFSLLENIYDVSFDNADWVIFKRQKKERCLDRADLTALLMVYLNTNGKLDAMSDKFIEQKNGHIIKKRAKLPLKYSLIVLDEFQNYSLRQIELLKTCVNRKYESIIYAGDTAQQINFGTIKDLKEIHPNIANDRQVILQKVYRNTKNILQYIQNLGYNINIPIGITDGAPVVEKILTAKEMEINYINEIVKAKPQTSFGILAKDAEYLREFKEKFSGNDNAHVLSMRAAQGVEFDIVFIVGVGDNLLGINYFNNLPQELLSESRRIHKDLLYVALTRAISELHIMGSKRLGDITKF